MTNNSTTPTRHGRLPLHIEVTEMLAREIKAGVLMDGEKLEPERLMAKRLGISVGTLRKALSELQEKGLIESVHGSGNYIRNIDDSSTIYGFFRVELLAGGGLPSATILSVDRVKGGRDIRFSLQEYYYRIRRLRYLNDVSVALEEIWLDASYAKKPLTVETTSDSLYQFYKEQLGFWIARVEDNISVSTTPKWCPTVFRKDSDDHWGYVERRSWDQHGQQAEFSRTWFDPNTAKYVARWK